METQTLKDIVIIYHGNCEDGHGAAYAAWKKFGENASYLPSSGHKDPPDGLVDKEIYILDYSYKKEQLEELERNNKSVMVIDHHKTAETAVNAFPGNIFDLDHSGATLAWRFFHPEIDTPELLRYVEDVDLWKFQMSRCKAYMAALHLYPMTFESWDLVIESLKNTTERTNFFEKGELIINFEKRLIDNILQYKERVMFEGYEVWAINASRVYRSILGNRLAGLNLEVEQTALGIVYYHLNGRVHISLRSHGDVDVSEIAEKYGGGGHARASSFNVSNFADLPFTFVTNSK